MPSIEELVKRIQREIGSNPTGTYFLNGPPGSGKSTILSRLASVLRGGEHRILPLGPYRLDLQSLDTLGRTVAEECRTLGFLQSSPPQSAVTNLYDTWSWIAEHGDFHQQRFLLLLDLDAHGMGGQIDALATLFGELRALEGNWHSRELRCFTIIASSWIQSELQDYCNRYHISFPYTSNHNQPTWLGLVESDFVEIFQTERQDATALHMRILHELSGGNPGIGRMILDAVPQNQLTFRTLLDATSHVAQDATNVSRIFPAHSKLARPSIDVICDLLSKRYIPATLLPEYKEPLWSAGILDEVSLSGVPYLCFHSWFVELVIRYHAGMFQIHEDRIESIPISELMPKVTVIHREAYALINDIENTIRNFATIQLAQRKGAVPHILSERGKQYNPEKGIWEDAYMRAKHRQDQSQKRGISSGLTPLIAYLSTRDLAGLIKEIASELRSDAWQQIGISMEGLSDIRNAVMHNQLIDDQTFAQISTLQAQIYRAANLAS